VRIREGVEVLVAILLAPILVPLVIAVTFVVGLGVLERIGWAMSPTRIRVGRVRRFRHYRRRG